MRQYKNAAVLLLSILSATVLAQEPASGIEQIDVTGEQSVIALRNEVQQLEQNMYTLYNSLNTNNEFDVACGNVTPTGSKLPVWECSAAFIREAQGRQMQAGDASKDIPLSAAQINRKYGKKIDELNADMMSIARQNNDLAKAMITLNAKQQELAALEGNGKKRSRSSGSSRTR